MIFVSDKYEPDGLQILSNELRWAGYKVDVGPQHVGLGSDLVGILIKEVPEKYKDHPLRSGDVVLSLTSKDVYTIKTATKGDWIWLDKDFTVSAGFLLTYNELRNQENKRRIDMDTHKFNIGDKIVGNSRARKYNITRPGWVGKVVKNSSIDPNTQIIVTGPGISSDGVWVDAECFDHYFGSNERTVPEIKQVIFNKPATIVLWGDDTKTVVKCQPDEKYDPEKGLALCISKKALGNNYNYFNVFKKYCTKAIKAEKSEESVKPIKKATPNNKK